MVCFDEHTRCKDNTQKGCEHENPTRKHENTKTLVLKKNHPAGTFAAHFRLFLVSDKHQHFSSIHNHNNGTLFSSAFSGQYRLRLCQILARAYAPRTEIKA